MLWWIKIIKALHQNFLFQRGNRLTRGFRGKVAVVKMRVHVFISAFKVVASVVVRQVRPLLVVTENEEKLSQKEQELKQVSDRYEKLRLDHDELGRQHVQVTEEKTVLAEQLRAEAELSAEAEEVEFV